MWRQRFVDISEGRVDKGMMLMMRDVAVAKKKEMGENAITKLQGQAKGAYGCWPWTFFPVIVAQLVW